MPRWAITITKPGGEESTCSWPTPTTTSLMRHWPSYLCQLPFHVGWIETTWKHASVDQRHIHLDSFWNDMNPSIYSLTSTQRHTFFTTHPPKGSMLAFRQAEDHPSWDWQIADNRIHQGSWISRLVGKCGGCSKEGWEMASLCQLHQLEWCLSKW